MRSPLWSLWRGLRATRSGEEFQPFCNAPAITKDLHLSDLMSQATSLENNFQVPVSWNLTNTFSFYFSKWNVTYMKLRRIFFCVNFLFYLFLFVVTIFKLILIIQRRYYFEKSLLLSNEEFNDVKKMSKVINTKTRI